MKKIFAALLVVFMLVSVLCACNDVPSDVSLGNVSDVSYGEVDFNDRANVKDGLPEKDWGGKTYTILQRTENDYEFGVEEMGFSTVKDLIYERDAVVEERFHVDIVSKPINGGWGVHEDFIDYVRDTVATGMVDYDIIAGYAAIIPTLIAEGIFIDWYDIPHVDLEREWWSQDLVDELTIDGNLYLLSGDISLLFWESMQGMFFNKTLAENAGIENLYDVVRDGEWTFDKMMEVIRIANVEDDNPETKIYGYTSCLTTQVDVYQDAFDIPVTTKDADGRPYFTINQEKTYTALQMVYDLVCGSTYFYEAADKAESVKMFGENRALFLPTMLGNGSIINTYDCNFGILPMPKFDTNQENYHTTCEDAYSLMAVPITSKDNLEFIGMITEALCAQSYRAVVPEWYTVILQNRYTKDEDSIEMIEIIREGILCNFGYIHSYALDWPAHQFNICINNGTTDFASNWQSKEATFNKNLEDLLDAYFD